MKLNLFWIDDDNDDNDMMLVDWPDAWRLPVAGETILIGIGDWVVDRVQWELQQGDNEPSVLLYVRNPEGSDE